MPRILICTVGGQPAPVVTAVRENGPLDLVVFLCTLGRAHNASAVTITRSTERQVGGRCPHCAKDFVQVEKVRPIVELAELEARSYRIEGVQDGDDLTAVLAACERIEKDLQARWPHVEVEVMANYTGGTKTMSLGLGLYALQRARSFWTLQLNRPAGGRPDLERVRAGDLPVAQDLSKVLMEVVLEQARLRLGCHDHEAAVRILAHGITRLRLRSEARQRLMTEHLSCRVLAARERFDFSTALELAGQDDRLQARFGPRFEVLLRIMNALESAEPWPDPAWTGLELVDEVRDNAERCAMRECFEVALARLHWATELLARLRLQRLHGVRIFDGLEARVGAVLPDAYEMLVEQRDALGRYAFAHQGELVELIGCWRRSLAGGGLRPVRREDWQRLAPRWLGWLDGAQEIL